MRRRRIRAGSAGESRTISCVISRFCNRQSARRAGRRDSTAELLACVARHRIVAVEPEYSGESMRVVDVAFDSNAAQSCRCTFTVEYTLDGVN